MESYIGMKSTKMTVMEILNIGKNMSTMAHARLSQQHIMLMIVLRV